MADLKNTISDEIELALAAAIKQYQEEVVQEATHVFEKRVREILARTVLNLSNYYAIDRVGANLLITVKIGGPNG